MPFNTIRTSPSLDRPSVALRLGSSRLPNSSLRNTGNTDNQYCKPRILSRLLATNSSSRTTIVQLTLISRGALSIPVYRARVGGPAVDPTRTTNRQLAHRGNAPYLRRRSKALSVFNYVVMVQIL
ncbi:hypothetical protein T01_12891 [Trichinella spiralis]|uniref:Uncharacterized protein n=1 Tax=Trichinella spiralis TaxID=6334 RepID=A0A0V1BHE2_TRISP|nr:hypothetical protein T01_12891 [Trichinella spiralis]